MPDPPQLAPLVSPLASKADLGQETACILHLILLVTTQLMTNYHCILSLLNKTPRSEEDFWRTVETAQN